MDKTKNRSDLLKMNNIDQIQFARLRPEKFDDRAVKEQIALIQRTCGNDIDPDKIALVFHECDYNMQKTIERIRAGEFEDGEWQTAKSTHKKKVQNQNELISNGNHINDNERSSSNLLARRFIPRRSDFRRTNFIHSNRNHFKSRSSNAMKSLANENIPDIDDNQSKQISVENFILIKQTIPSIIPSEPVRMHSTIKYSSQPIDIQFGDIQWNDNIPQVITSLNQSEDNHQQSINETTNQLSSSLSITDNTILNTSSNEGTSHLSDQLVEPSSLTNMNSYPSQQNGPVHIPITRLPPTSTPRMPEYPSPTSQYLPTNTTTTTTAFTSFNNYSSIPRDYSQTNNWNVQTSNYKTNSKTNLLPTTHFPQPTSYQISPQQQQQQIFLGTYPYPGVSPAVVQVFAPIEHWSHNGYPTPLESYTYSTTNYIPAYPNQQSYPSQTKYDHQIYDKEFYNQTQPIKDPHITSKLSPTAVTFSQGAPLTASPSTTALYINPVPYPMPNYYPSINGTSDRDNRHGTTNRTNYYHHGQTSRTYNTQVSNSTWHSQQ